MKNKQYIHWDDYSSICSNQFLIASISHVLSYFSLKDRAAKKNLWFRVWKGFFRVWDLTKIHTYTYIHKFICLGGSKKATLKADVSKSTVPLTNGFSTIIYFARACKIEVRWIFRNGFQLRNLFPFS